ncbi:MAG TPA: DUF2142 domain-containing protein [Acidimicrobiales bacterium]|nr:DUF2142 domain-containing protein [Acidimicrobiales bacterium]
MGVGPTVERRLWWRIVGLLVLAGSAWALALPAMTGPDEAANAIRAAAVARGQWTGEALPETVDGEAWWGNVMVEVEVPASFAVAEQIAACYKGVPREQLVDVEPRPRTNDCPELTSASEEVTATTYEYRGQPFLYLLTGLPTLLAVNEVGLLGMRLVGLGLCAALLASAFVSPLRLAARTRLPVLLGGLVALSPMVLHLASTQNAAGLEIAASLCLWAAGLALVAGPGVPDGRLVHRVGAAATVLVLTRGLSPGFAALTLLVLLLVARPGRVPELLGRTDVRAWLGGVAAATAVTGAWLVHIHEAFPLPPTEPTGLATAWGRVPVWVQGMIAELGSTDVIPPMALHWAWGAAAAVVLAVAVALGSRRHARLAVGLVVAGLAIPIAGEGFGVPQTGFWWQGRYVLPCIVGALLLAPAGIRSGDDGEGDGGDGARRSSLLRPATAVVLGVFVIGHVWAFAYALRHYTVGHDGPANPVSFLFDPVWSPPLPPALLLVAFTAAVTLLARLLWRSADPAPEPAAAPPDDDAVDYRPAILSAGKGG